MSRLPKILLVLVPLALAFMLAFLFVNRDTARAPAPQQENSEKSPEEPPAEQDTQEPEPEPQPEEFNKDRHSINSPASLWVIANKNRPLPSDYAPNDLIVPDVRLRLGRGEEQMQFSQRAEADLIDMFNAASADDVQLVFGSGYRSYSLQSQFYNYWVDQLGEEEANRVSAKPGTSEHQTGLSFDATTPSQTCHLEVCFESTEQGEWLLDNAYRYGFTLRYREGKESITGYSYEPWHYRYVGKDLAKELYDRDLTMEEFLL